jgi:hypothetical protein
MTDGLIHPKPVSIEIPYLLDRLKLNNRFVILSFMVRIKGCYMLSDIHHIAFSNAIEYIYHAIDLLNSCAQ